MAGAGMTPSSIRKQEVRAAGSQKSRDKFLDVFLRHLKTCHIDTGENPLVIGGTWQDVQLLTSAGFKDITLSNFRSGFEENANSDLDLKVKLLEIDAERIDSFDASFDLIFAHEVLHHCRSPHSALCEMLRVARKHVVLLEPNGSFMMRALAWMGLSFPYEIFSVVGHGYEAGGVRDSCVPNFIYRWTASEVRKTVSSYLAEYLFMVHPYPYWDFNVDAEELSKRKETRIQAITAVIKPETLLAVLRALQTVLNRVPILRRQGNKFFCCIEKTQELRPWLAAQDGKIMFNSDFCPRA